MPETDDPRIPTNLRAMMILEALGQRSEPLPPAEIGLARPNRREVMGWLMASGATIGMAGAIVTSASEALAAKPKKGGKEEPPKAPVTTQAEHNKNMARLEEVRKRREEAAARRKQEEEEAKELEEERKKMAALAMEEAQVSSEKKSSKKNIPKIDKIALKKMKPAQLKEALKERGLDIQGNAKQLQQRLMDYESKR